MIALLHVCRSKAGKAGTGKRGQYYAFHPSSCPPSIRDRGWIVVKGGEQVKVIQAIQDPKGCVVLLIGCSSFCSES